MGAGSEGSEAHEGPRTGRAVVGGHRGRDKRATWEASTPPSPKRP